MLSSSLGQNFNHNVVIEFSTVPSPAQRKPSVVAQIVKETSTGKTVVAQIVQNKPVENVVDVQIVQDDADDAKTQQKPDKKVHLDKKETAQNPPEVEPEAEPMGPNIVPANQDSLGKNETIATLQQRIVTLNNDADNITSRALSNANTSDLKEYQESLVTAIMAIQEATGEKPVTDEGMLGNFWNRFGSRIGLVKEVKKTYTQNMIENATVQENIDLIFESLEKSIETTEKDMTTLAALQESLTISVDVGNEMVAEIHAEIEKLGESSTNLMEKAKLEGLLRELKSINLVNANTANQINAQITTTSGLAQNLREVRPILKNLIKSQTLVALQNARMGQAKEVRDLVAGVLNDFVTRNNANTNATILDAIEYSGKTVIRSETIKELGDQHEQFVRQLNHIVADLNRQKLEYNNTVDRVTRQLGQGMRNLPQLMAGDTSQKALPSPPVPPPPRTTKWM